MDVLKIDSGLRRIAAIPEKKRGVLIWRVAAVIICLAWAIDFLVRAVVLVTVIREQDILSAPVFITFYAVTGALFIMSMFFPRELYIHGGLCWLWGLLRIIDGGSIVALSLHILGYLFLARRGFFRTFLKTKVSVAALVVLLAFATQIRYSVVLLVEHSLQLFDFSVLVVITVMIFYPEIHKAWQRWKDSPISMTLDPALFNAQDVAMLRKILAGDKYVSIAARESDISVSTLKKRVRVLYSNLGVQDRTDFMARYSRHTIELATAPESSPSLVAPLAAVLNTANEADAMK
jgi:hypothetical protein